jgi:hypothetical protein
MNGETKEMYSKFYLKTPVAINLCIDWTSLE